MKLRWNPTRPPGRSGAFAPVWSVLLAVLFYGAQLGPEVLDGLVHLQDHASQHPASAHYEDPGKQSHSDHCLISHARGESRTAPGVVSAPQRAASIETALALHQVELSDSRFPHYHRARAPPHLG